MTDTIPFPLSSYFLSAIFIFFVDENRIFFASESIENYENLLKYFIDFGLDGKNDEKLNDDNNDNSNDNNNDNNGNSYNDNNNNNINNNNNSKSNDDNSKSNDNDNDNCNNDKKKNNYNSNSNNNNNNDNNVICNSNTNIRKSGTYDKSELNQSEKSKEEIQRKEIKEKKKRKYSISDFDEKISCSDKKEKSDEKHLKLENNGHEDTGVEEGDRKCNRYEKTIHEKVILIGNFMKIYAEKDVCYGTDFLSLMSVLSETTLKVILNAGSALLLPHYIRYGIMIL